MATEYETRAEYLVLPADANDLYPLIFGGAFYSQMDRCAAIVARKFLKSTACKVAVTHISEVVFHLPSYSGEVLEIVGDVVSAHKKSIVIKVHAWRGQDLIATVKHVFISLAPLEDHILAQRPRTLPYMNHDKPYDPPN
jgi:acyl-CoA hydrolase